MTDRHGTVLLFGYGNPGRLDDGLGPVLADAVAALQLEGVTVETNYQLNVEDAAQVAEFDAVVFVDADVACAPPFRFEAIPPRASVSFTSHSVEPAAVLAMAHDMFGASTRAYALGIRGHEFNDFGERLSTQARQNCDAALAFIVPLLRSGDPDRLDAACGHRSRAGENQPTW